MTDGNDLGARLRATMNRWLELTPSKVTVGLIATGLLWPLIIPQHS